jgi:hypothetical protein
VYWLKKHGYFCGWRHGGIRWTTNFGHESGVSFTVDTESFSPNIRFDYTHTRWDGEKEVMDYRVELTTTICQYGGKRFWFICPLVRGGNPCRRRVGVLYAAGRYFGCRVCYDLAYASQQESHGGGFLGMFGEYLRLGTAIGDREDKLRVRYWKGQPTKRYARLLKKADRLDSFDSAAMLQRMRQGLIKRP